MFAPLSCKLTASLTSNGTLSGNIINLLAVSYTQVKRYFIVQVLLNSMTFLCFFSPYILRVMYPLFSLKSELKTQFPDQKTKLQHISRGHICVKHPLGLYVDILKLVWIRQ